MSNRLGAAPSQSSAASLQQVRKILPDDRQTLDTALGVSSWRVVDHLVFTKKIPLETRAPIFRALVHDHSGEALILFKKLYRYELRLQHISEQPRADEIQKELKEIFQEAVRGGNRGIVKVMLGNDHNFNQLVKYEVMDPKRFQSSSFVNKVVHVAGKLSVFHDRVERSLQEPEDFPRELEAIGIAAAHGRLDMIDLVMARVKGCLTRAQPFIDHAMRHAAAGQQIDTIKVLLKRKPTVTALQDAMCAAAANNRGDIIELLSKNVWVCGSKLAAAALEEGHIELARRFSGDVYTLRNLARLAMPAAAGKGNLAAVRALIQAGAAPRYNESGPLINALQNGHPDVAEELLNAGANLGLVQPSVIAQLDGRPRDGAWDRLFQRLIQGGCDTSEVLHVAALRGNITLLTRFIHGGVVIADQADLFQTALSAGHLEFGRELHRGGADLFVNAERLIRNFRPQPRRHNAEGDEPQEAVMMRTLLQLLIEHAPGSSELPATLLERAQKLRCIAQHHEMVDLFRPGQSGKLSTGSVYEFLCRAHLRDALVLIRPNLLQEEREARVNTELEALRKKTPSLQQLLNRIEGLVAKLQDIHTMTTEMADGLVLGMEQVRNPQKVTMWSAPVLHKQRQEALDIVGEHLLSEFDLPLISRFFTIWQLPTHKLPQEARPRFGARGEWPVLIKSSFRASNGFVVSALENKSDLIETACVLKNCIGSYTTACESGTASLFSFAAPGGAIVAALELTPAPADGDIQVPNVGRYRIRQFQGPSASDLQDAASDAKREFLEKLQGGKIPTNKIVVRPRPLGAIGAPAIERVTGIPIDGSDTLIRRHYAAFCIPSRSDEPERKLIPPGSVIYMLMQ